MEVVDELELFDLNMNVAYIGRAIERVERHSGIESRLAIYPHLVISSFPRIWQRSEQGPLFLRLVSFTRSCLPSLHGIFS